MHWIRSFVIEYSICPFAQHVVDKKTLRIEVSRAIESETALQALFSEINLLENHPDIETTLLILPCFLEDFLDYLDFVDLAEARMTKQGYDGVYQLATFHPDYCFAGVQPDDVSHYTNRSPYPMLHLLRETSLDRAIQHYGPTDQIPDKNIATMHRLGLAKIKKIIQSK
jgi:hypothetical protein